MASLKLISFDFHGGRGEPPRLALSLAGIPFEDCRVPLAEWPNQQGTMPIQVLPVLEVDGVALTQSCTISRYVGRLAGYYPQDPWQAALCDEVMDMVEDITHQILPTLFIENPAEKKAARVALASGAIPCYLHALQELLSEHGGDYFADRRLTMADFKVFVWVRNLGSGLLDYIPVDIVARQAPLLAQHYRQVATQPEVLDYYRRHAGSGKI